MYNSLQDVILSSVMVVVFGVKGILAAYVSSLWGALIGNTILVNVLGADIVRNSFAVISVSCATMDNIANS